MYLDKIHQFKDFYRNREFLRSVSNVVKVRLDVAFNSKPECHSSHFSSEDVVPY